MSEILDYTHLPETVAHSELVTHTSDQQSIPHEEPQQLSPLGGAVLIGVGVIAVGVLTWMNEHKGKYHSRLDHKTDSEKSEEAR